MKYELTSDAKKALAEREIYMEWLERTLAAPELTLPDANPAGGTLALVLSGKPGQKYILERSGDLLSWTPFATNTIATAGDSLVTNVVPVNASPRFFRARL